MSGLARSAARRAANVAVSLVAIGLTPLAYAIVALDDWRLRRAIARERGRSPEWPSQRARAAARRVIRGPWLALLLAGAANAHEVPDGRTAQEKCEVRCTRQHCDEVIRTRCYEDETGAACQPVHDRRDRCKRACAVSSLRRQP